METKLVIPAYTIEDVKDFTPVGDWILVATSDHSEVLGRMFNASFLILNSLSAKAPLKDEQTLVLKAA